MSPKIAVYWRMFFSGNLEPEASQRSRGRTKLDLILPKFGYIGPKLVQKGQIVRLYRWFALPSSGAFGFKSPKCKYFWVFRFHVATLGINCQTSNRVRLEFRFCFYVTTLDLDFIQVPVSDVTTGSLVHM